MIRRLYDFFFIIIFFSVMSDAFADTKTVFLDKDFVIKAGESVQIESGLGFIKFIKILEDSRCPVKVTCVWAGNVKAEFEIIDSDSTKNKIYLNSDTKGDKLLLKGYTIQLISILPPKLKGIEISAKNYQVKLRVKPAN